MKRSYGESADQLPWMGSNEGGVEDLFGLSPSNFLGGSPKMTMPQAPSLPGPPARMFALSRPEEAAPNAPMRAAGAGREDEQESGSSACSTSTDGTPTGRRRRASTDVAAAHSGGAVQVPQLAAPATVGTTHKMVRAAHGAGGVTRGQLMAEIPDAEDKEEPYHCSCGVGEVGVEVLIDFIRAHPKMTAVASDDGSPLLIRTVARQLVADMRRRRHTTTCTAFPKVPEIGRAHV